MKIVIDYKLDSWNETININRRNKYAGANRKKKESDIVRYFLMGIKPIKEYPIKLNCTWHVTNFNSDLDNKSIKVLLDMMQSMGILENDNIKHIRSINHIAVKDTKDYLEVEIDKI